MLARRLSEAEWCSQGWARQNDARKYDVRKYERGWMMLARMSEAEWCSLALSSSFNFSLQTGFTYVGFLSSRMSSSMMGRTVPDVNKRSISSASACSHFVAFGPSWDFLYVVVDPSRMLWIAPLRRGLFSQVLEGFVYGPASSPFVSRGISTWPAPFVSPRSLRRERNIWGLMLARSVHRDESEINEAWCSFAPSFVTWAK